MGYVVRVANKHGDFWLGQRVYMSYDSALTVKHNVADTRRYDRVYILPATTEQPDNALSVVE
jgi:hypothetical protein